MPMVTNGNFISNSKMKINPSEYLVISPQGHKKIINNDSEVNRKNKEKKFMS